ncbi:MAG: hypothetical protein Fur0025_44870 [Oscillatoriaceae cyanobacterium]
MPSKMVGNIKQLIIGTAHAIGTRDKPDFKSYTNLYAGRDALATGLMRAEMPNPRLQLTAA